jgi:peptidoglycan/xylan/chitin deacetylase (PgdA/CDA1 family)
MRPDAADRRGQAARIGPTGSRSIAVFIAAAVLALSAVLIGPAVGELVAPRAAEGTDPPPAGAPRQGAPDAPIRHTEPTALVTFTFDDGNTSNLTEAAPTLQRHGLTGTGYIVTGCVGMTSVPNECRAAPDLPYLTWAEITRLQSEYGWEIGSHGVDHQCLVSAGDGCQPLKLTDAEVKAQLADSSAALAEQGIVATAFAPPYGDYNGTMVATVAKHYTSMRGFHDEGANVWPHSDYLLQNVAVEETSTVAELATKVDEAIADKQWVLFTFHDVAPDPGEHPNSYQFSTAKLDELAAYVAGKVAAGEIRNVNVSDGLVPGSPNLLPNATFDRGITEGWSTDTPATVTADARGNGSYPDPEHSVKLVSAATPSHLFSPRVDVTPGTAYLFKNYLEVRSLTDGKVGFYVDEYDSDGTWVSGQYRTGESSPWTQSLNFTYTPTSESVVEARLQVFVEGTGITAYLDNTQMLALDRDGAGTLQAGPPVEPLTDGEDRWPDASAG